MGLPTNYLVTFNSLIFFIKLISRHKNLEKAQACRKRQDAEKPKIKPVILNSNQF